jgi:hypothetical protein
VLREIQRSGVESENITFAANPFDEEEAGWLAAWVAGFTAGWALAISAVHQHLRFDQAILWVFTAPMVVAFLAHLLGLALGEPAPVFEWVADSQGRCVRWITSTRVGLLRRRKVRRLSATQLALHWGLHDGNVELKMSQPGEAALQVEVHGADPEALARRAARALRHALPEPDGAGWSSHGAEWTSIPAPTAAAIAPVPHAIAEPSAVLQVRQPPGATGIAVGVGVALLPIAGAIAVGTQLPWEISGSMLFELGVTVFALLPLIAGAWVAERFFGATLSLDFAERQVRLSGRTPLSFPFSDITKLNVELRARSTHYVQGQVVLLARRGRFIVRNQTADTNRRKSFERELHLYARELGPRLGLNMKPMPE